MLEEPPTVEESFIASTLPFSLDHQQPPQIFPRSPTTSPSMNRPGSNIAPVSSTSNDTITSTSPTYILDDLNFLDKLPKKSHAEVLKNLRQIPEAEGSPTNPTIAELASKCYFLDTIRIEVRNMIYELLLVNPILGTPASITKKDLLGKHTKYGLESSILGACRQILSEASSILYEKNTFYLSTLVRGKWEDNHHPTLISAITRDIEDTKGGKNSRGRRTEYQLEEAEQAFENMAKVKRWRIFTGKAPYALSVCPGLQLFSHILCHCPPKHMEILLVPESLSSPHWWSQSLFIKITRPLRSLRNVGTFHIRGANKCELPDHVDSKGFKDKAGPHQTQHDERSLTRSQVERELTELVTGNSPVEFLDHMNMCLVNYASSFEPSKQFREVTAEKYVMKIQQSVFDDSSAADMLFKDTLEDHPVEAGLKNAHSYASQHFPERFKQIRSAILNYLEPQYQKVVSASNNLLEFMKPEKARHEILNRNRLCCCGESKSPKLRIAKGLVLLEAYHEALKTRDMPLSVRANIKCYQNKFDAQYDSLPSEVALRGVQSAWKAEDWTLWCEKFMHAVDILDEHRLSIWHTRAELFKWDTLNEIGTDFEISTPEFLSKSKINWNKDRPRTDSNTLLREI